MALRATALKPSGLSTPEPTLSWLPRISAIGLELAHAIADGVRIGAVADQVAEQQDLVVAERVVASAMTVSKASRLAWMSLMTR